MNIQELAPKAVIITPADEIATERVCTTLLFYANSDFFLQTIKAGGDMLNAGGGATGRKSVGRGDLDQAIRSMRDGKRRHRPHRPLGNIFADGAN
jgi:hypothetical protein